MSNNKQVVVVGKESCVVSCLFGVLYHSIQPAPTNIECYFFTNIRELQEEIVNKGWRYQFINLPLSDDITITSLQAKYIKFLQFRKNPTFERFKSFDRIIYVDHKLLLVEHSVLTLLRTIKKPILIREISGKTIWDMIGESLPQPRYRSTVPQLINYIEEKLKNNYTVNTKRIASATGLIVYRPKHKQVIKLVNEVYKDIMLLECAQCQIIWAMVTQKYIKLIQRIKFKLLR